MNRQWNVVATITAVCTLVYLGATTVGLFLNTLTFAEFQQAILPLITAWGGYLARMLGEKNGPVA